MLSFQVRSAAAEEIAQAFQWHESHQLGLGAQFLAELEAAKIQIQRFPLMHPVIYAQLRRALIYRFPYQILYRIRPASIVIVAVFHCKRDPVQWQDRSHE